MMHFAINEFEDIHAIDNTCIPLLTTRVNAFIMYHYALFTNLRYYVDHFRMVLF